jgi:thioredoxin 1
MAKAVTEATYSEIVEATDKPVMIDFWAEWCGPCRMIGPIVEDLSKEYEGKAVILKCDVDENPEIAQKFGIRNIPTLVFLKKGELVDKLVGAVQRVKITEKLDAMF